MLCPRRCRRRYKLLEKNLRTYILKLYSPLLGENSSQIYYCMLYLNSQVHIHHMFNKIATTVKTAQGDRSGDRPTKSGLDEQLVFLSKMVELGHQGTQLC
jgi:hypothetical protein